MAYMYICICVQYLKSSKKLSSSVKMNFSHMTGGIPERVPRHLRHQFNSTSA